MGEAAVVDVPARLGYRLKCRLLGKPLVSSQLHEQRLTNTTALGVLSSDCISSSAYGTEEMLIFLLPAFGLMGFHILMPMTVAVLAVLIIMTAVYRHVVMIYTRAGGSYVVARESFGPRVAQIATVALLIDYIVTVAVQAAAGTAAITSLVPALRSETISQVITIGAVLVLAYGNLRGVREAGRAFAFPTYFFIGMMGLVMVVGLARELMGDLPRVQHEAGMIDVHNQGHAILTGAAIWVLLKAFANGGASLTGLEAISNGVSTFKEPVGRNARKTLTAMSLLLGTLVLGVSWLSLETHATPYTSGSPTVISQVAKTAFGGEWFGHIGFVLVQVATALILYTGANTPFTGFPFLASFVAEDSFLPRQLTRRGHRLALSNGIVVLTCAALALLLTVGAVVDRLIPFYAIGVFTGFAMSGYGMARYFQTHVTPGSRRMMLTSLAGGIVSTLVVLIFGVVKFTEGAWLVLVLFPVLWLILTKLNGRYRSESRALDLVGNLQPGPGDGAQLAGFPETNAHFARHNVLVLVDRLDLAVLRALRYASSLRPTTVQAVHFMLDNQVSDQLQKDWVAHDLSDRVPLLIVECGDRRLVHGVAQFALNTVITERAEVTVLLPRRTFGRLSRRILHDRTADRIAVEVGRLPHVAATIVPFDTTLPPDVMERIEREQRDSAARPAMRSARAGAAELAGSGVERADAPADEPASTSNGSAPNGSAPNGSASNGCVPIGSVQWKQKVTVQGHVEAVQIGTLGGRSLEVHVFDGTGGIRLLFYGRTAIPGLTPGAVIRATGRIGEFHGHLALANPLYDIQAPVPTA